MKLDDTNLAFLRGTRFSNAQGFALGEPGRAPRRVDRLVEMVRGRRVVHVGCCDHLDLIRDKVAAGIYLHQQLTQAAQACVGVDTNVQGIALLRELGFAESYVPGEVP